MSHTPVDPEQSGQSLSAVEDRRATGRIRTPVQIRIRGVGRGRGAAAASVADNIGAGGFYVRLLRRFEPDTLVSALIRFAADTGEERPAARLAVRGRILRVEELPGGAYGVAVRISRYRFV